MNKKCDGVNAVATLEVPPGRKYIPSAGFPNPVFLYDSPYISINNSVKNGDSRPTIGRTEGHVDNATTNT